MPGPLGHDLYIWREVRAGRSLHPCQRRRGNGHETEKSRAEAVHWVVREVAFTHLNRLVALKAMEVRGLIPEIIQTRPDYGNRSFAHQSFLETHPELGNAPDDGLESAIKDSCRAVYAEFRILFVVGDPSIGREAPANMLTQDFALDPVAKIPEYKVCAVRVKNPRAGRKS